MSSEAESVTVTFWLEDEVSTTGGAMLKPVRAGGVVSEGVEKSVRTGLMPMAVNSAEVRLTRLVAASDRHTLLSDQLPPEYWGIVRLACHTPFWAVPD